VVALAAGLLPHLLGFVLPVAFLAGTVMGLGRLAEHREVIALVAAGVSPARLLRFPLAIAAALAALALGLAGWVEPAASALVRERVTRIVERKLANDVRAGVFYDQLPGYVLYAERVGGGRWGNVLIQDLGSSGTPALALAASGHLEPAGGGDMRLVLEDGELHALAPASGEYVAAAFDRATSAFRVGNALERNGLARNARGATLAHAPAQAREERARGDEAGARRTEARFHRRIAEALAFVPFALLAVPLGAARRRRAFSLGAAVLAVVLHYVLLRSGEVLAQGGALPPWLALELPTVVLSAAGLALVALQARRGTA
jgi:lipopolysaccharide export system permease protein